MRESDAQEAVRFGVARCKRFQRLGPLQQISRLFEHDRLFRTPELAWLPTNNRIVLKWHHNRENNEVVEFYVLHEDIREFMFLRKSVCLMRSKFGRRAVPRF